MIGVTAGLIAAFLPRLLPMLAAQQGSDVVSLFTVQYVSVATVFSLFIGVAMVWMYHGSRETPKNLFMSALALPAVLSGGIGVSTSTSNAAVEIQSLSNQVRSLVTQVEAEAGIETLHEGAPILLESADAPPVSAAHESDLWIFDLLGFPAAHAQATSAPRSAASRFGGIEYNVPSDRDEFAVVVDTAPDRETAVRQRQVHLSEGMEGLSIKRIPGHQYVVVHGNPSSKSNAVLNAVRIKKQYGVTPKLLRVR